MYDRKDLDMHRYDKKFQVCELYLSGKREDLLPLILSDPTSFVYCHLMLDGKRFKFYPYQDMIANDRHRYKIFRAANQIGKSLLLDALAVRNLIIDHGHAFNEAIVSKSLPQSFEQMRRVKGLLNTMPKIKWSEIKGNTDSMSVITCDVLNDKGKLKYTNMFVCAPCTEGLLGYALHSLNLDEFEYWDVDIRYFFNQIAQPRTYSTKGDITIFSNPNGEDSFVSYLEKQLTLSGKLKWHTYVFNYLDRPGHTKEEYEELKHELPRHEFESTVAAIRSLSDKNYFTPDEIERSYDKTLSQIKMVGEQPFGFLDVGAKIDQSLFMMGFVKVEPVKEGPRVLKHIYVPIIHAYPVGYPISRVVGSQVDESDGWHYEKSVKEHLQEWSEDGTQPVFGCDVTGNSGISPLFQAVGINPIDVQFSGPKKSGMYQRFKYYMEKGLLHRIKSDLWEKQARELIMTKGSRGYLFNAASHRQERGRKLDAKLKRIPDDCMDATAGLIFLSDSPDNVPVGLTVVEGKRRLDGGVERFRTQNPYQRRAY